jgi:hydroxyacyl-ACP dehydratase HTD2-like protein with hotdog domain
VREHQPANDRRGAGDVGERTPLAERAVRFDAVDLFLFSSATGLAHRIHYDETFARAEGMPGLPVHGPLQAAYLSRLASEWARALGGRLAAMTIRHTGPLVAGENAVCEAHETNRYADGDAEVVELELAVRAGERRCTQGSARVRVPVTGRLIT